MIRKTLVINGVTRNLVLDKDETLATVLREHLLLPLRCLQCHHERQGHQVLHLQDEQSSRQRRDHHHRGRRHAERHAPAAGGLDGPRLRPVRLLHARLHHQRQGPAREQSQPHPRRGPRLVQQAAQPLPLHRLQAADRRRDGRRRRAARRDDQGRPGLQAHRRQHQGHQVHPSLRRPEGHRHPPTPTSRTSTPAKPKRCPAS